MSHPIESPSLAQTCFSASNAGRGESPSRSTAHTSATVIASRSGWQDSGSSEGRAAAQGDHQRSSTPDSPASGSGSTNGSGNKQGSKGGSASGTDPQGTKDRASATTPKHHGGTATAMLASGRQSGTASPFEPQKDGSFTTPQTTPRPPGFPATVDEQDSSSYNTPSPDGIHMPVPHMMARSPFTQQLVNQLGLSMVMGSPTMGTPLTAREAMAFERARGNNDSGPLPPSQLQRVEEGQEPEGPSFHPQVAGSGMACAARGPSRFAIGISSPIPEGDIEGCSIASSSRPLGVVESQSLEPNASHNSHLSLVDLVREAAASCAASTSTEASSASQAGNALMHRASVTRLSITMVAPPPTAAPADAASGQMHTASSAMASDSVVRKLIETTSSMASLLSAHQHASAMHHGVHGRAGHHAQHGAGGQPLLGRPSRDVAGPVAHPLASNCSTTSVASTSTVARGPQSQLPTPNATPAQPGKSAPGSRSASAGKASVGNSQLPTMQRTTSTATSGAAAAAAASVVANGMRSGVPRHSAVSRLAAPPNVHSAGSDGGKSTASNGSTR